jgi:hypothetical protein
VDEIHEEKDCNEILEDPNLGNGFSWWGVSGVQYQHYTEREWEYISYHSNPNNIEMIAYVLRETFPKNQNAA